MSMSPPNVRVLLQESLGIQASNWRKDSIDVRQGDKGVVSQKFYAFFMPIPIESFGAWEKQQ